MPITIDIKWCNLQQVLRLIKLQTANGELFFYLQQATPVRRRLQYDRSNLARAYEAINQCGMSVYMAARWYSVSESTLRDRTCGNVDVDARTGHGTLLSADEEQKLVTHISYMADIGYGYNKSGIQYMACDYANSLGKVVPATEQLSNCF